MKGIIIATLCLLASSKVLIQGGFAKKNVVTFSDGLLFNGLIFCFSALIFCKELRNLSVPIFLYAAVFGGLTVLFQAFYIKAMSEGSVPITVLIVSLGMMLPILNAILIFREPVTVFRLVGIVLTVIALSVNAETKGAGKQSRKWLFFCLTAFFANGGLAVCQQYFGRTPWGGQSRTFVACSYLMAAVFSAVTYAILRWKGGKRTFALRPKVFGFALAAGLCLGVFQALNTYAIQTIDGTLLFPVYNGGSLILSCINSVLILKETLQRRQIVSCVVGISAIIMMNLR